MGLAAARTSDTVRGSFGAHVTQTVCTTVVCEQLLQALQGRTSRWDLVSEMHAEQLLLALQGRGKQTRVSGSVNQ
jgi:signal recognition particle GTPase